MNRNTRGFTIIEVLVVIAILGFLAASLAIATVGLALRAKVEKTTATVRRLDTGCEAYKTKFQDYPSQYPKLTAAEVKGGKTWPFIVQSDVHFFELLAKSLPIVEGFSATGAKTRMLDPFVEIVESERRGDPSLPYDVKVLDAFGEPILYDLPGTVHGDSPDHSNRFDIRSSGPDRKIETDNLKTVDDVTNWNMERR